MVPTCALSFISNTNRDNGRSKSEVPRPEILHQEQMLHVSRK